MYPYDDDFYIRPDGRVERRTYKPPPPNPGMPQYIKKEKRMSSALDKRKVQTQMSGALTVSQSDITVDDLRDFVEQADIRGVEGDSPVHIKSDHIAGPDGNKIEVKMAVEIPVVEALGSSSRNIEHPRTRARKRIAKKAAKRGALGILGAPLVLAFIDLFIHVMQWLVGKM